MTDITEKVMLEARCDEIQRQRNLWEEDARQYCINADYYRSIVVAIGEMLGQEAKLRDDGSTALDVLCAKVPELVRNYIKNAESTAEKLRLQIYDLELDVRNLEKDLKVIKRTNNEFP